MSDFDPITLARFRFLSHEVTADDYAEAVLDLNTSLGEDVLAYPDLKKGTELRARLAVQDTRLAFGAITRILTTIATTEEQRENLVFLLAKAIDDSLNLGAFYMAGRRRIYRRPSVLRIWLAEVVPDALRRLQRLHAPSKSGSPKSAAA